LRLGRSAPTLTSAQWAKADRIQGWFDRDEAELLFGLTRGPWCEVGCWKGRSTTVLAETGFPGWAVDWFKGSPEHPPGTDTYPEFMENLRGYGLVRVLPVRFEDAVPYVGAVNLLHLDAEHSFDATERAFRLFEAKVDIGGHVVFHDACGGRWPDVEDFVVSLRRSRRWQAAAERGRLKAFRRR